MENKEENENLDDIEDRDEDFDDEDNEDEFDLGKLKDENESLSKEVAQLKDKYLRLAAEYKNYQERSKKEKIRIHSDSVFDVVSVLIPTIDDIERTLPLFLEMEEKYSKGVNMILRKMHDSLKSLGVESFGKIGEEFDPSIHNASSKIDGDGDKTVISEVYQKGYKIKDKLIRPAMVQVSG